MSKHDETPWDFGMVLTEAHIERAHRSHFGGYGDAANPIHCVVCRIEGRRPGTCYSCRCWREQYARWKDSGAPVGITWMEWKS